VTRVRSPLAAIALSGVTLTLVAACSSSGGGSNNNTRGSAGGGATSKSSSSASGPQQAANVNDIAATPRDQVKDGGSFTWAISQTIPNFNYYNVDGSLGDLKSMWAGMLPRPFLYNASGVPTVNTDYFTSITKTKDSPQTISYKINPKAKWSDGTPVTWEDLQSLWKASNGKNTAYKIAGSQGYDQIQSVEKGADDHEAIVTFAKPFTDWQSIFDPLVPKSLTATPQAFNTAWKSKPLVTAGPFMWGSTDKTHRTYTILRDPKWWGNKAKLDKIVFAVYDDPDAAVQALGPHTVDFDDISLGDTVSNVKAASGYSGIDIRRAGGPYYRQITISTKNGPLTDEKVRQAVVLGINRQAITSAMIGPLGGNPKPLQNHFFMSNQAAYTETCGKYCDYNPGEAKKLLESAGWKMGSNGYYTKDGKELDLTITLPAKTPNATQEAQVAQATLKGAGIKLTLKSVSGDDFFPKYIDVGNFEMTVFTWQGTQFPVAGALSIFKYDPKNIGQNYGSGGSEEINKLLEEAATQTTTEAENKLANEASTQMWDNAAWLPLYQRPQFAAVKSGLVNIGSVGFAELKYEDIGYKA